MSCGLLIIICYRFREYLGSENIVASAAGRADYSDPGFEAQVSVVAHMQEIQKFRTDKNYAVNTCERLRAFRENAGLTASAVAEHLKVPTPLYVLYEKYELVPHQLIPPLCKFLNISPWNYLTGLSDELSPPFQSDKGEPDEPT